LDHVCDEPPSNLRFWAKSYRRLADALDKATEMREREEAQG
jgi:hypothetical protein